MMWRVIVNMLIYILVILVNIISLPFYPIVRKYFYVDRSIFDKLVGRLWDIKVKA